MTLPNEEYSKQKPPSRNIQESPPPNITQKDPLIDKDLQVWQYSGIVILAVGAIAAVGFFSRRVEYALLFAITLSIVLIVFFITV